MHTLPVRGLTWSAAGRRLDPTRILAALVLGAASLTGCADQKAAAASAAPATAGDTGIPAVLATVGGEQVTLADVRARAGDDLDQMEGRYRRARHKLVETALQDILRERVVQAEAREQGKTVDQLVAAEAGGPLEPTDAEIAAWHQANQARTNGRSVEQLRPQIADYLRTERRKAAEAKLEARLHTARAVTVKLEPYRVPIATDGAPSAGPADARVTLVEFSDFQCPYCNRFVPTLKQVEQNYKDRVRVVYRQFPLTSIHPNAFKAAEASLCANDQGRFWQLHDLMFQEQDRLTVRELKAKAGRLGLDQAKFDTCLDSGRHTEQVQEDMRAGSKVGVTGTPAVFVNGVMIDGGAVPYDVLARAIDKELARTSR